LRCNEKRAKKNNVQKRIIIEREKNNNKRNNVRTKIKIDVKL